MLSALVGDSDHIPHTATTVVPPGIQRPFPPSSSLSWSSSSFSASSDIHGVRLVRRSRLDLSRKDLRRKGPCPTPDLATVSWGFWDLRRKSGDYLAEASNNQTHPQVEAPDAMPEIQHMTSPDILESDVEPSAKRAPVALVDATSPSTSMPLHPARRATLLNLTKPCS